MGKLKGIIDNKKLLIKRDFFINWLELLAPKTKVNLIAWILLYQKYGSDIFYIFNLMAGINIKMPSYRTMMDLYKQAKMRKDYPEFIEVSLENTVENE